MFVTALVGRIVPSQRSVELASAGHPAPLRLRDGIGVHEEEMSAVPPLGIVPVIPNRSHQLTLEPGERLVFFTDGLTESFNPARTPLELSGIEKLLQEDFSTASDVVAALERGEAAHRQDAPPHDDLTILVLGL
jgi:sigma-B regulation protein RsbU (phosphoserine phosphatase)